MKRAQTGAWLLIGVLGLWGCGSDGGHSPADAGDASPADGAHPDAEVEGGLPDGEAPVSGCSVGPENWAVEPISPRSDRSYALSVYGNQVEVIWTVSGCGKPGRQLRRLSFATSEALPSAETWLGEDACRWRQNPALLQYPGGQGAAEARVEAYYAQRVTDGFVSMRHGVEPTGPAAEVTAQRGVYWDARGLSATLLADMPLLAWVGAAPGERLTTGRAVYAQRVHEDSAPTTVVDGSEGQRPTEVAVAAMGGGEADPRAALAWASHAEGDAGGIFLSSLAMDGTLAHGPERLLAANGASARVALAGHPSGGGALAYVVDFDDAGASVRLQPLTARGRVDGNAQQITPPSLRARDVSVAAFGVGYVLAYRMLSPQPSIAPALQLAFTDAGGNLLGRLDLAEAEASGGPTSVATANDGRLVVAWVDIAETGAELKVWRGTCR